jgi:integrase
MQWFARLTLVDGGRKFVPLDPSIPHEDMQSARKAAADVSALARNERRVDANVPETVREYGKRWLAHREERGLTSVSDDRGRLTKWVHSKIGEADVTNVDRGALEELIEDLDRRVRARELSWKTAWHAWALTRRMFGDACSSKSRALRVRADNPAAHVIGPDRGVRKTKVYLYPDEFARLVSSERVPLRWRRVFAIATYLYLRAGELNALRWDDVDLERGVVLVHRSANRVTGELKSTKTSISRRIPIERELLPLLRVLHAEANGSARVVRTEATDRKLSRQLRRCLALAGVTRPELFPEDDGEAPQTRKPMTFHDLRATGITWMAVRGDEPLRIKQRAGHSTFSTTEGYIREAENLRDGFGVVFPPLPPSLILGDPGRGDPGSGDPGIGHPGDSGLSDPFRTLGFSAATKRQKNQATEWRRRESNPGPKTSRPMLLRVYPMIYIAPGCAHRQALPGAIHLFDFA